SLFYQKDEAIGLLLFALIFIPIQAALLYGALKENLTAMRIYFRLCIFGVIVTILSVFMIPENIIKAVLQACFCALVYYYMRDLIAIRDKQARPSKPVYPI